MKHWPTIVTILGLVVIGFIFRGALNISKQGGTYFNAQSTGGTALALSSVTTSTLTAAQVCGKSFLSISPVSTTPTITLPATNTLFTSCIPAIGNTLDVNFQALNTSSILVAGAGGTIINSSATTVAANKGAVLRFIHDTNVLGGTYLIYMINVTN